MYLDREKIKSLYPYFSMVKTIADNKEYIGIILSHSKSTLTFIDINQITSKDEFTKLIELSQQWWWYSNRLIPINLYYYEDFKPYMRYVVNVSSKNANIVFGHSVSLETIVEINKNSRKNKTLRIIN